MAIQIFVNEAEWDKCVEGLLALLFRSCRLIDPVVVFVNHLLAFFQKWVAEVEADQRSNDDGVVHRENWQREMMSWGNEVELVHRLFVWVCLHVWLECSRRYKIGTMLRGPPKTAVGEEISVIPSWLTVDFAFLVDYGGRGQAIDTVIA